MTTPTTAEELLCQAALYSLDNEKLYGIANVMLTNPHRFAQMLQTECCERAFRKEQKR